MKKLLSTLLAASLLIGAFAGCGTPAQESKQESSKAASTPASSGGAESPQASSEGGGSENEPMTLVVTYPLINGVPADNTLI